MRLLLMFDERKLQTIWYEGKPPSLGLRVLATVYSGVTVLRRWLYRSNVLRSVRLPVPVIVVGNINVGGTGKTPLTIALVGALRERGFTPGVVSRGYGSGAIASQILGTGAKPAQVGDEPVLIARATGVAVAVGRDRVATARLLLAPGDVDVIVADDGLQHYRLRRDVEICVIDGERRFGNGRLLPAGPLREPLGRLAPVDFRVCNGGETHSNEVPMRLVGDTVESIADTTRTRPLREFARQRVHAVAGIGNPQRFFTQLRTAGIAVIEHPFPDHHAFTAPDLNFGDRMPVLMTEKDAVKCAALAQPHWWSVPVRAELPAAFFDAVADRLRAHTKTR